MNVADLALAWQMGGDAAYVWSAVAATLLALAVEAAALSIRGRDLARRANHADATVEGR